MVLFGRSIINGKSPRNEKQHWGRSALALSSSQQPLTIRKITNSSEISALLDKSGVKNQGTRGQPGVIPDPNFLLITNDPFDILLDERLTQVDGSPSMRPVRGAV